MSLYGKIRSFFSDSWCRQCGVVLEEQGKETFFVLPMNVGEYISHTNPNYYVKQARYIASWDEIPTGAYACCFFVFSCPQCGEKVQFLRVFLKVRDMSKSEDFYTFKHGELNGLEERAL